MAAELFINKLGTEGGNLDIGSVVAALQQLLPTEGGEVDLASLVNQFMGQGGGLASLASSWLGNGANEGISAAQITDVFGGAKLNSFADQLGIDANTAAQGLSDVVPSLIDKNSEGGNLLGGAAANAANIAKDVFGKLF